MKQRLADFITLVLAVLAALFAYRWLEVSPKLTPTESHALTPQQQAIHDDALRAMNSIKISMEEYYTNTGKWPESNAAAGIPPPEAFRGTSLRRLDLDGWTVRLTFDAKSGVNGGTVVFTGSATPQLVMGIQWHCTSPSFPYIAKAIPDCTYTRP